MQAYQLHVTALTGCTILISLSPPHFDASTSRISPSKRVVRPAAPDSPGRAKRLPPYPLSRRSRRQ